MKKLLSIVLISAMILSFVPTAFASTTENEPGMKFVFNAAAYNSDTEITTPIDRTDYAVNNTDPWRVIAEANTTKWLTITANDKGSTSYSNVSAEKNALAWFAWGKRVFESGSNTSNLGVALYVQLNESGTFIPKITYEARRTMCIYDIYLIPASVVEATENGKKIINNSYLNVYLNSGGSKNLSDANKKAYKIATVDMSDLSLSEDETMNKTAIFDECKIADIASGSQENYYLFFHGNGINDTLATQYGTNNAGNMYTNIYSFELIPIAQYQADQEFTSTPEDDYTEAPETATVTRLAYYGEDENGAPITDTLGTSSVTYGESVTIDGAAQTVTKNNKTYNFSYWARGLDNGVGNKQVLSTALSFPYKPSEGNNYLIAVYEEEGKAEEAFYNYNGQLLTDLKITDGALPALPAMAGLGNATKWVQRGTNLEFDGSAAAPTTGDMVFMAKYDEPTADITINGKSFKYGDTVSCISLEDTGYAEENFSYWTRTIGEGEPEIISIDANYSFSAYTDCTITAVCNGAVTLDNPRKIALSTFSVGDNLTAVMAEFIGFGDAKEKGIMFGGKKIAMTTDKVQFTVTNDTKDAVEVTGYAIVGNDKYVDGEITVAAAR